MSFSDSRAIHSWPLERYAKFIATQGLQLQESAQTLNQGHWKQFQSQGGSSPLQIMLLESNSIVVSDNKVIHESFSLFNANKWLKACAKGDSMLFMYRMNNDTRRFRIKFNKSMDKSAAENCSQFVSRIKSHIPVKKIAATAAESESQVQLDDSQQTSQALQQVSRPTAGNVVSPAVCDETSNAMSGLTLPDLANKAMSSDCSGRDPYTCEHVAPPKDRLSLMIRLCLTDANFPAFVEAVENELLGLTASKDS